MQSQNMFSQRKAGFYLGLAGGVLALAAGVLYLAYAKASGTLNTLVLLPLALVIVLDICSVFCDSDYLPILSAALAAVPLCVFLIDSVYTFVGYFLNLAMFGDASMMGAIVQLCAVMGMGLLCQLLSCFLDGGRKE